MSFPARGPVLEEGKRVRLTGELTTVDARCQNIFPAREQVLEFEMVGGHADEASTSSAPGISNPLSQNEVPLKKNSGGTLVVPVEINEAITLDFTLDSGATDVTIPADVFSTLKRKRTVQKDDIIGDQIYAYGDGSTLKSFSFTIKTLKVGGIIVEKVKSGYTREQGELLLGQSFLARFRSWSIDNNKKVLLLEAQ